MDQGLEILKNWYFYAISFVASAVSYKEISKKEDSWRLILLKFTANFLTSLFAGLMSYLSLKAMSVPAEWTWVFVGIFAWRGAKGLEAISEKLDKWIGVQNTGQSNTPPK
jgi:hypothetical protein